MLLNKTFASVALDRKSLPQDNLDIAERFRTNFFPWKGQFSPQLVEELLTAYAPRGGVILDPFVGSGTSLIEAARQGLEAHGSDLNPAAVTLSRLFHLINLEPAKRTEALVNLRDQLETIIPSMPLFCAKADRPVNHADIETRLIKLWRESTPGTMRTLAAALVVLCDFHHKHLNAELVHKTWLRLDKTVRSLPESKRPVFIHHSDARALPMESNSVDLVLTSPPYINVHNYHQQYRRSVEAMKCNVLAIARSEIGSNRQNRGNRFLTVIQYSLDMVLSLREMARTARTGALLILVLGRESLVRGGRFFNGEIVADLATRGVGLEIERRQERLFLNRYGTDIYEDILHFRFMGEISDEQSSLETARLIAGQVLTSARPLVPAKVRSGVDDALERLYEVSPSPRPPADLFSQLLA